MTPEETELLQQLANASGSPAAVNALLEAYRGPLVRMVRLRLDRRLNGRLDASDVVQEALLDVTKRLPDYLRSPDLPPKLWLRFLTKQKLKELLRHHLGQGRDPAREQVPDLELFTSSFNLAGELVGGEETPSRIVAQDEDRGLVEKALDLLHPIDRELLVLRHFEQLSHAEAAAEAGLTPTNARRRYLRALVRLQTALESLPGAKELPPLA